MLAYLIFLCPSPLNISYLNTELLVKVLLPKVMLVMLFCVGVCCVVLLCFLVRVVSLVLGCCVLFCLFVCFDVDVFPFAGMIFVFLLFALRFMFADLVGSCCFICAVLCWVGLACYVGCCFVCF